MPPPACGRTRVGASAQTQLVPLAARGPGHLSWWPSGAPGTLASLSSPSRDSPWSGKCLDSRSGEKQTTRGRKALFDSTFLKGGLKSSVWQPDSFPSNLSWRPQFHPGSPKLALRLAVPSVPLHHQPGSTLASTSRTVGPSLHPLPGSQPGPRRLPRPVRPGAPRCPQAPGVGNDCAERGARPSGEGALEAPEVGDSRTWDIGVWEWESGEGVEGGVRAGLRLLGAS